MVAGGRRAAEFGVSRSTLHRELRKHREAGLSGANVDQQRRAWITDAIVKEQAQLLVEHERLEGIRAGRRLKPRNINLGWTDRAEAQTAYLEALRAWIEHLRDPDKWLTRFFDRPDFGSLDWRAGYSSRRHEFVTKRAWEPAAERQRPHYVRKRAKDAQRRELEREQRTGTIDRAAIYERDKGLCGICGKPVPTEDFELDHVVPLSLGGAHGPENLRAVHDVCNTQRGNGYSTLRLEDWTKVREDPDEPLRRIGL